ncbi:MAG: alkaline phosphatase [Deltaproteobacteria bacterium]|nr:alkaline phosphatase [Deltaproteobacteria bacterium]
MNIYFLRCRLSIVTVSTAIGLFTIAPSARAAGPATAAEWYAAGQRAVQGAQQLKPRANRAKNVILFVGDGMGITTVTAARILEGQLRGESGEDNSLSFEKFPYVALSKTYSVNQQTPDSAPTMTAMVTGVKTKDRFLSVNQNGIKDDYTSVKGNELTTILELAEQRGLSTGVVTTTTVTHATPGACYAHTVDRDWEWDGKLPDAAKAAHFPDIARQLIEFKHGNGLEVALGGGRSFFLPTRIIDPEEPSETGARLDDRDLVKTWLEQPRAAYAWNKSQLDAIDLQATDHLLGLFERSHMKFEADRASDAGGEPSLSEMTHTALAMLKKNKKGFFLMVEGGRIDHGHHMGNAYRALTEAIEFSRAVTTALQMTDPRDTLIIVTADHSHTLTMAGYPKRGNPILGKVIEPDSTEPAKDQFGLPYTTLNYANGPGYTGTSDSQPHGSKTFPHMPKTYKSEPYARPDLTNTDTTAPNYMQEAIAPFFLETHGGEDVAIYATGPGAHLVHGVLEQNVIFHIMKTVLLP